MFRNLGPIVLLRRLPSLLANSNAATAVAFGTVDNATVHCTYEKFPTVVGNNVSIGHNAIVHGCTIEDNVLIGMGARKKLAPGTLWAGVPAKEIGPVPERLRKGEIERIANNYLKYSSWYKDDE